MPVVCIPNCIFLSETSRMIAIYQALTRMNVEVRIATHGGPYEFVLKEHNISYDIIKPEISEVFYQKYLQSIYDGGRTQNYSFRDLLDHVKGEIDYFEGIDASLVVTGFTLSAKLSAAACGIPLVVTHLGSWTPVTLERYGVQASEFFKNAFTQFLPPRFIDKLATFIFTRTKTYLRNFNEVSKHLGIPSLKSLFDLLLGDHTLITDVPEILGISEEEVLAWKPKNQNLYRPGIRLAYSGPIFAQLFGEVPSDVINFLNTRKPIIYVAMNSGHKEDLKKVYRTVAEMDVFAVMVSTLHGHSWEVAPNILVKSYLPSHLVMPLCDMAIIHGGQGTVQTAIASGIPLIGFPLQPEQNFNLRRIQDLGAGICMAQFDLRKGKLKASIKEILNNPVYRKNAQQLAEFQKGRDGPVLTAQYIREIL